ncbi:MAG: sigma-70 family RNA polymerase sigma factor [Thermosipho sp. (in: Bacteria)]|nr:sigma-70 family RNA polymerase sigma factor [Thermosipho sp. (in: thermotogales)]
MGKKKQTELIKSTEDWMRKYRAIKKYYKNLCKKIEFLEKHLVAEDNLKGVNYDKVQICKTFKFNSIVEEAVLKEIEKLEQLKLERDTYKYILEVTENAVESLKFDERRLVYLYYLSDEKLTWYQVARIMNRSVDNVKGYLKRNAIKNLAIAIWGIQEENYILTDISS